MQEIQTVLNESLMTLATGVISLLSAYGVYYLRKASDKVREQAAQIKDERLRRQLDNAIHDVGILLNTTVGAIEQTTAKKLREAVKDGKVDRAELEALSKQAFAEIKAKVKPEAQKVIKENLGSFDEYLSNMIEFKVLELKALTNG